MAGTSAAAKFKTQTALVQVVLPTHLGEDSTWQCRHAWLQYSPMFSCKTAVGFRTSGGAPAVCNKGPKGQGPGSRPIITTHLQRQCLHPRVTD